jgi:cell division protease FtsH
VTLFEPNEDRLDRSYSEFLADLVVALGGRAADKMVFGEPMSGAIGDIQQVTRIARRMVTQFGMSEKVGVVAVGDREQEIFLGREISQRREVSERMSEVVDAEIKRLVDAAYARASEILTAERDLLDRLAETLLERETIDREDIDTLARGEPLPPRPSAAPAVPPAGSRPGTPTPRPTPVLGAPPAEPAGA